MGSAVARAALSGWIALVCAILCPLQAFASKDAVPDWVRDAAHQPRHDLPSDASSVVLLDDTKVTVAPDGTATEHRRHVVRMLRPAGRDAGMIFVPFRKDTKILSLAAWSIGPDGHEYVVNSGEFHELGYPGRGNFYEDLHAMSIAPPARDPGAVVAFEYTQKKEPYLHGRRGFCKETSRA